MKVKRSHKRTSGRKLSTQTLMQKREKLKKQLFELLDSAAAIQLSFLYRRCGNPKCKRCRTTQKKHGPFPNLVYREDGKSRGFYVPVAATEKVKKVHADWRKLKKCIEAIGKINREILRNEFQKGR